MIVYCVVNSHIWPAQILAPLLVTPDLIERATDPKRANDLTTKVLALRLLILYHAPCSSRPPC